MQCACSHIHAAHFSIFLGIPGLAGSTLDNLTRGFGVKFYRPDVWPDASRNTLGFIFSASTAGKRHLSLFPSALHCQCHKAMWTFWLSDARISDMRYNWCTNPYHIGSCMWHSSVWYGVIIIKILYNNWIRYTWLHKYVTVVATYYCLQGVCWCHKCD